MGGVWFRNRYPGARCDVESMSYSYSFDDDLQQEWSWSERYATQPEILRYLNHVANRFDLRRDIQLETRVSAAHYDEAAQRWDVFTDRGEQCGDFWLYRIPSAPPHAHREGKRSKGHAVDPQVTESDASA